uniref:uncharacterized protein LOC100184524 n=1 Tax=Ciona intestinalis TaxID=7719 RepID=UPI000180D2B2|nr:uncharacterized protein LOC100184524 [Ciona intestinalis]|eukprot:XP_002125115.1 uncharacterized protein LOC100184524 [Ciona intestinalis]
MADSQLSKVQYKRLSLQNVIEIQDFIGAYYSPNEEMRKVLNVPIEDVIPVDKYRTKKHLEQNFSIGAFDSDKLVGVILNEVVEKPTEETATEEDPEKTRLAAKYTWSAPILRLVAEIEEDPLKELAANKLFMMNMITVHTNYTKRGLASELMRRAELLAINQKCDCLVTTPSSGYTLKAVKKLGMIVHKSIDITTYVDKVTDTQPFKNISPPHNIFALCYKTLKFD